MFTVITSRPRFSNLPKGIFAKPNIFLPVSSQTFTPIRRLAGNLASSNMAAAAAAISPIQNDDVDRIAKISSTIRVIPDFPKPGIMFQDITTLLLDPVAFKDTIDLFVDRYKHMNISVVAEPLHRSRSQSRARGAKGNKRKNSGSSSTQPIDEIEDEDVPYENDEEEIEFVGNKSCNSDSEDDMDFIGKEEEEEL